MDMITFRERYATPGKILLWGALFAISQSLIALILESAGVGRTLLQLQLTPDARTFITTVAELSDPQMDALLNHFYLDFLHPLWYGAFALTFTAWLFNRLELSNDWNLVLWGAPLMALLDLVENSIHMPVLLGHLPANELTIGAASLAATIKWGLGGVFLALDTLLIIAVLFSSRGRRAP